MACLSPGMRFDARADLSRIEVTLAYGGDRRGSEVAIRLDHDEKLGGEVLGIEASGY